MIPVGHTSSNLTKRFVCFYNLQPLPITTYRKLYHKKIEFFARYLVEKIEIWFFAAFWQPLTWNKKYIYYVFYFESPYLDQVWSILPWLVTPQAFHLQRDQSRRGNSHAGKLYLFIVS